MGVFVGDTIRLLGVLWSTCWRYHRSTFWIVPVGVLVGGTIGVLVGGNIGVLISCTIGVLVVGAESLRLHQRPLPCPGRLSRHQRGHGGI